MKKKKRIIIVLFLAFSIYHLSSTISLSLAQEPSEEIKLDIPVAGKASYNIQKYSGFNFFANFIAETAVKTILKLKTHAKDVNCNLEIYSGWDLIKKKVKSFHVEVNDFYIKNVPLEYLEITTLTPIYLKKNKNRKNKVVFPVTINSKVIINPISVIEILDNMARSHNALSAHEIELPIPPLGSTKVLLKDLMVQINESGFVQSELDAVSIINPNSEPLRAMFTGNVVVSDKKLLVSNLQCEIEDIFTKDSDASMAFCEAIGELINPIVNFHKYEKGGITIDNVNLVFPENKLLLEINLMLLPEDK